MTHSQLCMTPHGEAIRLQSVDIIEPIKHLKSTSEHHRSPAFMKVGVAGPKL